MNIKQLWQEDDAVSPVIGVILMVAITVILAAVIASFVLGLGDSTNKTPQAKFTWDYNANNNNPYGNLTVTHDGGTTIKASELVIRGQGFSSGTYNGSPNVVDGPNTAWSTAQANGSATTSSEKGGDSAVVSGDYMRMWVDNDYDLRLVYESSEGDNSATLASDTGPKTS
ncbi:type IV pilin [Halorientalis brevis]|uniref:Type IV pilin n=1 Tax=Halorientalis brevis TaxID=1126241 RepID=A0ABD6C681_9EURY|nr:type IV pilin N-terminal domain-containing protein [Halorientalis brevis]